MTNDCFICLDTAYKAAYLVQRIIVNFAFFGFGKLRSERWTLQHTIDKFKSD